MPVLSLLTFLPVLGGLLILAMPAKDKLVIRVLAAFFAGATMALSLWMWSNYSGSTADFQFVEKASWIPAFHIHYFLGVDGLSLPLMVLTTVVSLISVIASFSIEVRLKEYFFFFMLLESSILGVFASLDLFLFYVFWEVTLIPMYFLIGMWGGEKKEFAAIKYFIYTLVGSVFMLIGILALYLMSNPHTFDFTELLAQNANFTRLFQLWVFLALFLGFAVKIPIFPFHTWLPITYVESPTAILVLSSVLLKMGLYGLLRFSFALLPVATQKVAFSLLVLATINIVYGAFCALGQTNLKRMIAYSSFSHMGYALLGLASLNAIGLNGAVLQMINHTVISGALFLLAGMLYARTGTYEISAFGGLGVPMPVLTGMVTITCYASLGLPLLSGFVGEFLSFLGAFQVQVPDHRYQIVATVALAGVFLTAAFLLIMIRKIFLGPLNPQWGALKDMNLGELVTTVPLVLLMLVFGVSPELIMNPISATVMHWVDLMKIP